jgi:hypothetical protein
MRVLKSFIDELFSWKWIVFILILFPYEASLRQTLFQTAIQYGVNLNQWDFIFQSLNNHIFIFYFLLPVWLLYSCFVLLQEWDYSILLRTRGFNRWMTYTTLKAGRSLIWFQCIWLIIILLVSRGLPYERSWSTYAVNDQVLGSYSFVLQGSGIDPLILLILQPVLLSLFLLAVQVSMAAFYVVVPWMPVLSMLAVFYFIGGLVSFRMIPPWNVWLRIDNFMILSSSVYAWDSIIIAFAVPIGIILFLYIIVRLIKSGFQLPFIRLMKDKQAFLIYFVIGLLGLFFQQSGQFTTVWDYFYVLFFGVSADGFALNAYLYYCIIFYGAAYLFQLQLHETTSGFMYYQVLRYRSYYRWFAKLLANNIAFIGILLFFWALIIILIGCTKGLSLDAVLTAAPSNSIRQLAYQYLVNGLLQMMNYWFIVFIVHWVWKKSTANLIIIGLLIVAGMMNNTQLLPAGLNSLGFITGDITSLLNVSLQLIFFIAVELATIIFLFTRRKIIHEGGE